MRHERRMYEQLKQDELALRAVADNASDLVRMIDEDGQLVYVSPSCERILGYSREEMLAMPPRALLPEAWPRPLRHSRGPGRRRLRDPGGRRASSSGGPETPPVAL